MKYILIILLFTACDSQKEKTNPVSETVKDYDIQVRYSGIDSNKRILIKINWDSMSMRVLQVETGLSTWEQDTFFIHDYRQPLEIYMHPKPCDTVYLRDTIIKTIIRDVENLQIGRTRAKRSLKGIGISGTDTLDPAPETARAMFWEFKRRQQKR